MIYFSACLMEITEYKSARHRGKNTLAMSRSFNLNRDFNDLLAGVLQEYRSDEVAQLLREHADRMEWSMAPWWKRSIRFLMTVRVMAIIAFLVIIFSFLSRQMVFNFSLLNYGGNKFT